MLNAVSFFSPCSTAKNQVLSQSNYQIHYFWPNKSIYPSSNARKFEKSTPILILRQYFLLYFIQFNSHEGPTKKKVFFPRFWYSLIEQPKNVSKPFDKIRTHLLLCCVKQTIASNKYEIEKERRNIFRIIIRSKPICSNNTPYKSNWIIENQHYIVFKLYTVL